MLALGYPNSNSLAGRVIYDWMRFGDSANNRCHALEEWAAAEWKM